MPAVQARGQRLEKAREALRLQVRDYVEKQMQLFTANQGRRLREDVLSQIRLTNLDQSDLRIMRELVRKMAKKLVALHARRKKVDRRGILDVRKTIRANIEFDGLMFHTKWKQKRIDRPKVMVVCDVSNSVAPVARFLLMFLYSVQEVLPKVRSFAFSNALGEITQLFDQHEMDEALAEAIKQHGGGGTDYGQAFVDFAELALDDIDHRTTVLIMGDARSNYTDPRADVLKLIHQRARRVLFLNPERKSSWDSGDSVMRTPVALLRPGDFVRVPERPAPRGLGPDAVEWVGSACETAEPSPSAAPQSSLMSPRLVHTQAGGGCVSVGGWKRGLEARWTADRPSELRRT